MESNVLSLICQLITNYGSPNKTRERERERDSNLDFAGCLYGVVVSKKSDSSPSTLKNFSLEIMIEERRLLNVIIIFHSIYSITIRYFQALLFPQNKLTGLHIYTINTLASVIYNIIDPVRAIFSVFTYIISGRRILSEFQ